MTEPAPTNDIRLAEFTATNGIRIDVNFDSQDKVYLVGRKHGPDQEWTEATASAEGIVALREYFRHEEDKRLGRWRWPEQPDHLVYPKTGSGYLVLIETGAYEALIDPTAPAEEGDSSAEAVRAYLAAHAPWKTAHDGSIWELPDGQYLAADQRFFRLPLLTPADPSWRPALFSSDITAARQIWPDTKDAR